jgi:hypothetical protein
MSHSAPETATSPTEAEARKAVGRRVGYAVAIACNVALLVILNNLLEWGWFPWLTADLGRALPYLNASLIASAAANAVYLFYDAQPFKGLAELGLLVVSLVATIRLLQIFPFDFSAYDFAWGTLVRWVLGVGIFGICVGMVVQVTLLARLAVRAAGERPPQD